MTVLAGFLVSSRMQRERKAKIVGLYATAIQGLMGSGRTKPCIFFCEDVRREKKGEYVVTLKAGMETGGNVNEQ